MSSPLLIAPSLDITSTQLESLSTNVMIPLPHVLAKIPDQAKFEHVSREVSRDNSLLSILEHREDCFRTYVLEGEILPIIITLKPGPIKQGISSSQLQYFAENVRVEISFKKRDRTSQQTSVIPSLTPFYISNSYAETPRLSQRELQSLFIMDSKTLHSFAFAESSQTIILLTRIPIHLPSELKGEKLTIDVHLKCESQLGQATKLNELYLKNEEKYLNYLVSEREIFYKPLVYETKLSKNIILTDPFVLSYNCRQLGDLNFIQIAIKHNNELEENIESEKKKCEFLQRTCCINEDEKMEEKSFYLDQMDFVMSKSISTFSADRVKNNNGGTDNLNLLTLNNYFSYKLLQNKTLNSKILISPFCQYSLGIQIEKLTNSSTAQLESEQIQLKCKQCQANLDKDSVVTTPYSQPNLKIKMQSQPMPLQSPLSSSKLISNTQDDSLNSTSENTQKMSKVLQKSHSAVLEGFSPSRRAFSVATFGSISSSNLQSPSKLRSLLKPVGLSQTTILEGDENAENEISKCDCLIITNSGINLANTTPLIIRWQPAVSLPQINTISQYQLKWTHSRKDLLLTPNTFYHLKMDIKNLSNSPLSLTCELPRKISSSGDNEGKVVAICKQGVLNIGNVSPQEEVQTSFEYYLLSEGSFQLNKLVFIDSSKGSNQTRQIAVNINLFEIVQQQK